MIVAEFAVLLLRIALMREGRIILDQAVWSWTRPPGTGSITESPETRPSRPALDLLRHDLLLTSADPPDAAIDYVAAPVSA